MGLPHYWRTISYLTLTANYFIEIIEEHDHFLARLCSDGPDGIRFLRLRIGEYPTQKEAREKSEEWWAANASRFTDPHR
jgi:hypothetical protein